METRQEMARPYRGPKTRDVIQTVLRQHGKPEADVPRLLAAARRRGVGPFMAPDQVQAAIDGLEQAYYDIYPEAKVYP